MWKKIDYIVFVLFLAFTTFEYFFREEFLFWGLGCFAGIVFGIKKHKFIYNKNEILLFFSILFILYVIQCAFVDEYKLTSLISRLITLLSTFFIAVIIKRRFVRIFISTLYWISCISLLIYGLCLFPSVKSYLMYQIAPNFVSLNVQKAVFEGGGINIIIYNFQVDYLLESIGLARNCGPFWEPGMFAVFLSMALFMNVFLEKTSLKYCNIVFITSLITTFSTAGYITVFFIAFIYIMQNKKYWIKIGGFLVLVGILIFCISNLDFLGEKISKQINAIELGNDLSRFSAILTQFEMIASKPIFGGALIKNFTTTFDYGTLASGTFLVFVTYGIPVGIFFYYMLYKSMRRLFIAYNKSTNWGILFFMLLILLSVSQTLFSQAIFITILFVGLMHKTKKAYEAV